jgi:hypothetical protein
MYISRVWTDKWDGNHQESDEIDYPTLEQVEAAIRHLDGQSRTSIGLETVGAAYMGVGGGHEGRYVVFATYDNATFYNLADPVSGSAADAPIRLNVGGQAGDYPARLCVRLDTAILAARTFAADGTLEGSLSWEPQ